MSDGSDRGPSAEPERGWVAPDPNLPRKGEMYVVSVVVSLLAALLFWGSASFKEEAVVDVGTVEPETALNTEAVPAGAFVTLSGRPDVSRISRVYSRRPGARYDVLLVLREAPRLVVFCPGDHPLGEAIRWYRPKSSKAEDRVATGDLAKLWTVSGRVYDSAQSVDPQLELPAYAVRQFVTEALGLSGENEVRILAVGVTPGDVRASARSARGLAIGLAIVAVLLWVLTVRGTIRDRRSGSG